VAQKRLEYKIGADISELRREMEASGSMTRKLKRELSEMEAQQKQHRQTLVGLGQGFATFGTLAVVGLGVAAKAAMDWETAWTGVRKTVDGSDAEMAALEGELRKMARSLPATHKEIAAVAEAAGQLGIKRDDIAKFTKTMIDLGNTTNLTAEEAATGLAKFSNIMGTSAKDVDRLGSSLVALGNDGASTEKDILEMALRIAGAGKTIGLAESDVLGLASALSSVGITAEGGGSSISTTMVKIASSVQMGGGALRAFAKVAGVSGDEFAKKFRDDAAGAVIMFIQGLGRMQKSGENVFQTLDDLGLNTNEVRDTLLRASGASDMFTKSLRVGSSAWAENTALAEEANKRYETSASKLQVAGNQIKDALIDVGATVGPVFAGAAQSAADLVRFWQELPGPLKEVVTWVGLATAGITLFGGAALIAVPKILMFRESMRTMVATGGAMSGVLGKFGLFMSGPWGAALGVGVGLLAAFGIASGGASRKQEELAGDLRSVAAALREQNGVANQSIRLSIAKTLQDQKINVGQQGLIAVADKLGLAQGALTDAVLNQGNAYDEVRGKLKALIEAGTTEPISGSGMKHMSTQAKEAQQLLWMLDRLRGTFGEQVRLENEVAGAAKGATGEQKKQAEATEQTAVQAKEAADALNGLITALDKLNGTTLTYRAAHRDYLEQLKETGEVLAKNGKGLDEYTPKGRENAAALDAQAKAAGDLAEAAAREAESTGGAAAGAAALTASLNATRPALVKQAEAFGMNKTEADAYVDKVLANIAANSGLVPSLQMVQGELIRVKNAVNGIPPDKKVNVGVLSQEAMQKLRDLGYTVNSLPDGSVEVSGNTWQAHNDLGNLINTINRSTASVSVNLRVNTAAVNKEIRYLQGLTSAHGNIVSFAGGGIEDHRPQVVTARPGTVRVWAEPETDKESYIPWAMDRRARATGILATTADGFGYALVPKSQMVRTFAQGGMTGGSSSGGGVSLPSSVTLNATFVDSDGTFIGRMQGVAQAVMDSEGRNIYLAGGRR